MKRLFSLFLLVSTFLSMYAQLDGTGYYRVQNYGSKRYIYVCDGTSDGVNLQTTSADMGAVQTWTNLSRALTDPASVIYIEKHGDNWDLLAQGTGVHQLINYYVGITELSHDANIYQVSATVSGQTLFLYDTENSDSERGKLGTGSRGTGSGATYSRWQIFGMNQTDNYIALAPHVAVGGKHYAPYYVSFPFSLTNPGTKAYYVSKVDKRLKVAVMKEVTGVVPSSMPVIIECPSAQPEQNKLQLEAYTDYTDCPADNLLDGVYFSNPFRESPIAYRIYDRSTMRVLGRTADGRLGYVVATTAMLNNCGDDDPLWCLKANQSYLPVDADAPAEITLVTEAEYEAMADVLVQSVALSQTQATLQVRQTLQLLATIAPENATNKNLEWISSNGAVASVADGEVTALAPGTAIITARATDGSGCQASCQITVQPALATSITLSQTTAEVKIGQTLQLSATVLPDYAGNRTVSWQSSNAAVATVDAQGLVKALSEGQADITATAADGSGVSATCAVTVKAIPVTSIALDKTEADAHPGDVLLLTATVLPDDATQKNVEWESDNAEVATVSDGLVTVLAPGQATITVRTTDGTALSAQCVLNSLPIFVESITLNRTELLLDLNATYQLQATVLPENATLKSLVWETSDAGVATVSQTGLVTGVGAGDAVVKVTAADGSGLWATCAVTCSQGASVESLRVDQLPAGAEFYSLFGQRLPAARRGVCVMKLADGTWRKVMVR